MIAHATQTQIDTILHLLEQARLRMHASGIPQWDETYPNRDVIQQDIVGQVAYVYMQAEEVGGYFVLSFTHEPAYARIQEGHWRNANAYGVIHRLALADALVGHGVAQEMFAFAKKQAAARGIYDLRTDTHAVNIPMQKALQKAGFQYCGIITLADGSFRNAYQAELARG